MHNQINNLIKENNELLFNILKDKYKDIIKIKALSYSNNSSSLEDYITEAELSIYKAIDNNNKDILLNPYINKCINNSLIDYYKHINTNKNKLLNEAISITENTYDNRYDPELILLDKINYTNLKDKIIDKLTWKEELVFTLKEQNFTIKEISEITDNNLRTVYNIINRVKTKISNICQMTLN